MARKLHARSHSVTYLGFTKARSIVELQGFSFAPAECIVPLPTPGPLFSRGTSSGCREQEKPGKTGLISSIITEVEHLVRQYEPKLLVFDPFLLPYYIAFWAHGIPAVALSTKPFLDWDLHVPPYTSAFVPMPSAGLGIRVQAAWLGCWAAYGAYKARCWWHRLVTGQSAVALIRGLAAAVGYPLDREWVRRPVSFDFCLRSVPELVLWTPGSDLPRRSPLRSNVRYVGASVDLERREPGLDLRVLPPGSKLAYCSVGSLENRRLAAPRRRFLNKVIEAFRALPEIGLLVAAGVNVVEDQSLNLPPNVRLVTNAPQLAVLRRAHLMLTEGGSNSIKECVHMGVPMLVYPRNADQPGNSARILFHGLGLRGHPEHDSPSDIASKVIRVLNSDDFKHRLNRLRAEFIDYDARNVDVNQLEHNMLP